MYLRVFAIKHRETDSQSESDRFIPASLQPKGEDFSIYMGREKFENADLIRYGLPNDLWCNVTPAINHIETQTVSEYVSQAGSQKDPDRQTDIQMWIKPPTMMLVYLAFTSSPCSRVGYSRAGATLF